MTFFTGNYINAVAVMIVIYYLYAPQQTVFVFVFVFIYFPEFHIQECIQWM